LLKIGIAIAGLHHQIKGLTAFQTTAFLSATYFVIRFQQRFNALEKWVAFHTKVA
jgi:hypothetical protein